MTTVARRRYRVRDASSWYEYDPETETVTLVVQRRAERSMHAGGWNELRFAAPTVGECEAAYDRHCLEGAERSKRQAERRAKWGV